VSNLSVVLHCSNYSSLFSIIKVSIYYAILLVFTLIANSRGHNVWSQSVKDTNFFAPARQVPDRQMVFQSHASFVPQQQTYAMPNMQQPMQGVPLQNLQFQGVPFQDPPLQHSPQPLPMQDPLQNFNPQGFSPRQFQTPLPPYQTLPPTPRILSPQV
jgi:hypothetical protein